MKRVSTRLGSAYVSMVVRGRWIVVGAWLVHYHRTFSHSCRAVAPAVVRTSATCCRPGSPAVVVQQRSLAEFAVPLVSQTSVVVHRDGGLDPMTLADVGLWALAHVQATQRGAVPPGSNQIIAAIPIPTAAPDTAVTYLFMSDGTGLDEAVTLADRYAAHFHNQPSVQTYVTGLGPAQSQQGAYLRDWIGVFEVATLVLIGIVVAIVFQSLIAPVAVLLVAGLGYLVSLKLLGLLAGALGFALPDQLTPLLAALLLGVVTDYCVLFFFAFRDQVLVRSWSARLGGAGNPVGGCHHRRCRPDGGGGDGGTVGGEFPAVSRVRAGDVVDGADRPGGVTDVGPIVDGHCRGLVVLPRHTVAR